uniref:LysM domain-containing protein n=1 Tax=Panagrolaimus superbus TaxID=310955 RepID=A0A914ZAZ8_9BILA
MTNAVAASANNAMVQPGETLYGVARRLNVSPNDLMAANNITDPNMLRAGQSLTVPGVKAAGGAMVAAATNSGAQTLGQLKSNGTQAVADAKQAATNKVNNAVASATGGYTVQSGDTLHAIAQRNGVTAAALKQANGMSDGTIRVGQSLVIPASAAAAATQVAAVAKPVQAAVDTTVKTASTPPAAAKQVPDGSVKPYTPPQASNKVIEEAEQDVAMAPSATGISQMRWPVRGKVLTSFGQRDGGVVNDGIDIMVPEGTAVKAAENGVVIYAGDGLKEFARSMLHADRRFVAVKKLPARV